MNDRQRSANISSNKKLWLTYRIHTVTRAHIKIQTALGCAEEPIRVLTKTLMALGFVGEPIQVHIKIQTAPGFVGEPTQVLTKIQTALGFVEVLTPVLTKTLMALGFVEVPIQVLIKIQMALGFAANTWPEPNNTLAKVYILNRKPLDRQCLSSGFEGN